ncbi:MAG TPA: hypothetical protein VGH42_02140 [Verrucomicrobiae bacterium]|jgi:hypothetical protein
MKIQIDLKSAVCGLIVGVAAMFAIGADSSSNQVGRYQIQTCPGNPSGYAVVLDTATGKVWMGNGNANQLRSDGNFFDPK